MNEAQAPDPARQLEDMQVILSVAQAMAGTQELPELVQLILDSARRVLHADRATLFRYDAATNELHARVDGDQEVRFPADRGVAGAAAQSRQIINIPDAYSDPRFHRDIDHKTGYRTRCLLTVPLIGIENKLVGVLQALNKEGGVFTAYDERLAQALAAQIAVGIQRAQLMMHYVQKKQWEHGMDLAREIQQSLWPKAPPAVAGYDIAGWSQPADTTGGDCFDYVPLPGGRWAIVLADASGHGIGSALVIAETRALLRALSGSIDSPEALLERVNSFLFADLSDGRFVTALYGVLDPARHTFEYASAGQAPLFWYRARERRLEASGCTGLPLAVLQPNVFDPAPRVEFAPGDFGVFLTDGFAEAHLPQGPLLGEERLMAALQKHAHRPARELITVLEEEVHEHLGALSAPDDCTAVIVKRVG